MSGTDQSASAPAPTADDLLVVGLGASAGGITALRRFFSRVTPDGSTAYVVILHLSPDHDSHLAEVLQVRAAVPGDPGDGERTARARSRLRHLAEPEPDAGRRPSRGGRDHARRAAPLAGRRLLPHARRRARRERRLRRAVRDRRRTARPASSASRSMAACRSRRTRPRPSTRTCRATPLPPAVSISCCRSTDIPARIVAYRDHLKQVGAEPAAVLQDDSAALREVLTLLKSRTGHDFSNYKPATVLRRIHRRMTVASVPTLVRYAGWLREHPDEAAALMKDLLISVTHFFRDPEAFAVLEQRVMPRLFDGKGPNDQVRVWVPACATGEEAYSIAMLLAEHLDGVTEPPTVQVFATDLDEAAIATARDGLLQQRRRRRHPAGAARSLLPSRGDGLSHPPRAARDDPVRAPQPDQGSAVLPPRSDLVPQPAHLPQSRGAGSHRRNLPFRAAAGRLPAARAVGVARRLERSVRRRSTGRIISTRAAPVGHAGCVLPELPRS